MNILKKTGSSADGSADSSVRTPADYRLPVWFFAFEGVLAAAFDILQGFPAAWPVPLVLLIVNITLSLTMRGRGEDRATGGGRIRTGIRSTATRPGPRGGFPGG
ncbi:hypothetical protein [Streptomyces sp. G-G2]|uniref:hypothetical protein n=1 Tax=Streptomyces sp. G-G2 TaxID=3046201 RepID=UPI0024B930A7|nr:hypothetical protein [Streptomyces sp. G-G2]MDJ0382310.1 hypothetical protein [Streptomyces sp. G-G2]